jgi:hypothetical protein
MYLEGATMPTYGAVEPQVRNTYGFVPKTCWQETARGSESN